MAIVYIQHDVVHDGVHDGVECVHGVECAHGVCCVLMLIWIIF